MTFYVYAIYNNKGKVYIGYTVDIEKRLARHNNLSPHKKSSFTYKQGQNWQLVYSEEHSTREEARRREQQLKSSRGRNFIRQMIEKLPP
ncbi:MAG: GIY-YIG nuclease family protein [Candidatus Sungbacteria bacterium]|nr:GIY-YIG nuclease family protein [Candidatus Sungbacteria bacterium]